MKTIRVQIPKKVFKFAVSKKESNFRNRSVYISPDEITLTNTRTLFVTKYSNPDIAKLKDKYLILDFVELSAYAKPLLKGKKEKVIDLEVTLKPLETDEETHIKGIAEVKSQSGHSGEIHYYNNFYAYEPLIENGYTEKNVIFTLPPEITKLTKEKFESGLPKVYFEIEPQDEKILVKCGVANQKTLDEHIFLEKFVYEFAKKDYSSEVEPHRYVVEFKNFANALNNDEFIEIHHNTELPDDDTLPNLYLKQGDSFLLKTTYYI